MEQTVQKSVTKAKIVSAFTSFKIKRDTKKRLVAELVRANRKPFGRPVTIDEVLLLAVCPLRDDQIKALQETTLSNADRLEVALKEYQTTHPGTSKDAFLGMLLTGGGTPRDREGKTT